MHTGIPAYVTVVGSNNIITGDCLTGGLLAYWLTGLPGLYLWIKIRIVLYQVLNPIKWIAYTPTQEGDKHPLL